MFFESFVKVSVGSSYIKFVAVGACQRQTANFTFENEVLLPIRPPHPADVLGEDFYLYNK